MVDHLYGCYDSFPVTLELIGRDGGLSTVRYSCGFSSQQRLLKTFIGSGCLCSEDGVVSLDYWCWKLIGRTQSLIELQDSILITKYFSSL